MKEKINLKDMKTEPAFVENEVGSTRDINNHNEIINYMKIENNLETIDGSIKSEIDNTENDLPDIINLEDILELVKTKKNTVGDCGVDNKDINSESQPVVFDPDLDEESVLEEPPLMIKSEPEMKFRSPPVEQSDGQQNNGKIFHFSGAFVQRQLYNPKIYICFHCNYQTKYKHTLKEHVHCQHNPNLKLLSCSHCGYQTKRGGNLKQHVQRIHNPETLKCSLCDFQTNCRRNLTQHIHYRHNPDPEIFKCSYCNYRTNRRGNLKRHAQCSHDPELLKCSYCDLLTNSKRNLNRHVYRRHNSYPEILKCSHCDYVTNRRSNLKRHARSFHNPDPE